MTKPTDLYTLTGDGAFGFVHEVCIAPLLAKTGKGIINNIDLDWSLPSRFRTDGKIIPESLATIMDKKAASVKYPGATADQTERDHMLTVTGAAMPETPLGRGSSPNAAVRGEAGLDASIIRPPAKSAALIKPVKTQWKGNDKVEIRTLDNGRKANAKVYYAEKEGDVSISHVENGTEKKWYGATGKDFHLKAGSPVSVTHVDMADVEDLIRKTFDEAKARNADVRFTNKYTVLTSIDALIAERAKEIFKDEYQKDFEAKGLEFSSGLVDDSFAYLLANEWKRDKKPLIMLCPDDSYGAQMQEVLAAVKEQGLNYDHTKNNIAVARLSNGFGDEYGGIHLKNKDGSLPEGTLKIKGVAGEGTHTTSKDDMWLIASHDVGAAKTYANRMIDYAIKNKIGGKETKKVYFGFDINSPAEKPLAEAIEKVINERSDELAEHKIAAYVRNPATIASEMLTMPPQEGTLLALNNLWGDIMADLFPALANNKASFDSLLISDKGFMVETGAGGTAGDLLFGKDNKSGMLKNGTMMLNPIAILSGYAHAIRHNANPAQQEYADQLEDAIDRTLKQGYLTADLAPKGVSQLREEFIPEGVVPHAVDTRVFVQAVAVNLLELQGKAAEATDAKKLLAEMEVKHDLSNPTPPDEALAEILRKYQTKPYGQVQAQAAAAASSQGTVRAASFK